MRILLVEDNSADVGLIREMLSTSRERISLHPVRRVSECLAYLEKETVDAVLLDLSLPDSHGWETFHRVQSQVDQVPIIVLTGLDDEALAVKAVRAGAQDYLVKGELEGELLVRALRYAQERKRVQERLKASEARHRALFDRMPIGLYQTAPGGQLLDANAALVEMLGYPDHETLLSVNMIDLYVNPADRRRWQTLLEREEVVSQFEIPFRRHDGQVIWVENNARAVYEGEQVLYYEGSLQDVTDRRQVEEKVKQSRDYYRAIIDGMHDRVLVVDQEYRVTDVNAVFLRQLGYRREQVVGNLCYKVLREHDQPCREDYPCPVRRVFETGQPTRMSRVYQQEDDEVWFDLAASPLFDDQGRVVQVIEAYRDVTAERRLEDKLAGVHTLGQELVLSRNQQQIAQVAVDATMLLLQGRLCQVWLVDREENALIPWAYAGGTQSARLTVLPLDDERSVLVKALQQEHLVDIPDLQAVDGHYPDAGLNTRSALCVPLKVRDRVIGVLTIESQAVDPFSKEDKRLLSSLAGYTALAMDNARLLEETSHRLAETRMLQEVTLAAASTLDQDRLLERVAAAIQDAVRVEYLGFLFPDETGEQLITHPSLVAPRTVPADRLNAPLERSVTGRAYTTGQSQLIEDVRNFDYYFASIPDVRSELAVPVKVGDRVVAVLNAESERLSAFDEDDLHLFEAIAAQVGIAMENARLYAAEREQRRLLEQSQSQLVQSEKLAATGRLAASLAHEINNPLQAIHNSLQLMLTFSLDPEEQREYMEMADEEVQRLIDMVGRILDFARRPRQELKPTDLNDVIEKVLRLSHKYLQHRRVVLKRDLSDRLPLVLAAPGELSQVFLNLVLNAVDVMPEGGTLRVSSALGDEGDVQIEVADTGPGIAPEYRDLIFEPFFSTKPNGTGLGLSVSHNIVRRHQGEISARNLDGDGALFTVRLPILEAESAKEGEN